MIEIKDDKNLPKKKKKKKKKNLEKANFGYICTILTHSKKSNNQKGSKVVLSGEPFKVLERPKRGPTDGIQNQFWFY